MAEYYIYLGKDMSGDKMNKLKTALLVGSSVLAIETAAPAFSKANAEPLMRRATSTQVSSNDSGKATAEASTSNKNNAWTDGAIIAGVVAGTMGLGYILLVGWDMMVKRGRNLWN